MGIFLGVVYFLICFLLLGPLGSYVAQQKHRDEMGGYWLGFLFGPLGVLVEACLPNQETDEEREKREQRDAAFLKMAEDVTILRRLAVDEKRKKQVSGPAPDAIAAPPVDSRGR